MGGIVKTVTDGLGLTDSGAVEDAYKNMSDQQKAIMRRLDAIDLPDIEKMKIALEMPELVGLLEAEQLGPSALEDITSDPRLESGIMDALAGLRDRAEQGLTAQDRLATEELLGQVGAQEMAQRKSIEQDMARRGMEDSGASLAAKLQGQQSGANQARNQALQLAAQANQNRMSALQNLGQMSAQQQQARFGQQANIATAKDRIAQANMQARQNAATANLAARQSIADRQTALRNQQQQYNRGLEQQQFENQMRKAGAQGQAQQNIAGMYGQQAQAQAQADAATTNAIFSTAGSLGAAAMGMPSDKNVKVKVEDGSNPVREMLDKVKPYKYNYDPEQIEDAEEMGPQLGVMAQDLEQSELGEQFVQEDVDGIKRVDYGQMASAQMAGLADLNERIKALEELLGKKGR